MELFRKRWFAALFMAIVILLSIGIGMLRSWEENKGKNAETGRSSVSVLYAAPSKGLPLPFSAS